MELNVHGTRIIVPENGQNTDGLEEYRGNLYEFKENLWNPTLHYNHKSGELSIDPAVCGRVPSLIEKVLLFNGRKVIVDDGESENWILVSSFRLIKGFAYLRIYSSLTIDLGKKFLEERLSYFPSHSGHKIDSWCRYKLG